MHDFSMHSRHGLIVKASTPYPRLQAALRKPLFRRPIFSRHVLPTNSFTTYLAMVRVGDMAQTADKLIQAKVQWWNRSSMYVRCPSYEEIHRHGFFWGLHLGTDASLTAPTTAIMKFDFHLAKVTPVTKLISGRLSFVAGGADPTEYFLEQGKQLPAFAQESAQVDRSDRDNPL